MSAPPTQQSRPLAEAAPVLTTPTKVCEQSTATHQRTSIRTPYIHATDTAIVTARSGRTSQVLVVRCTHCGPEVFHLHKAPLDFSQGKRTCPTTRCAYVVISGVLGIVREVA